MKQYLVRQLPIALRVYIGQVLVGYALGWTAPVIPKLQDPEQTPLPEPVTDGQTSWVGSMLFTGVVVGPYISGYLSNLLGRKASLLLGGLFTALSFILLATAHNLAMMYAGRIVMGFGTGIIMVTNLVYLGEIASTNIRGFLLTCTGMFLTFGTLVVYSVGPYVSYAGTSYIGLGITIVYIFGIIFVPETPVYHALKGNDDEVRDTLVSLGREEDVNEVLSVKLAKQTAAIDDWKEIFTVKSNRTALTITLTLNILQQMSGVVVVVFFATTIFELAGSSIDPDLSTIVIGGTQFGASCVTPFFVERAGRRVLLLGSTFFSFISLAVLGIYFFLDDAGYSVANVGWLPLVTLMLFFLSFDLGFGIIPATLMGEMFRTNVRGPGSAVSTSVAWLFGFGLSSAFSYMISGIGGAFTFWIFAAACATAFVFTMFFVPETRGKTLFEIQEMLNR